MTHKQPIMTDAQELEFLEDLETSPNPLVNTLDAKRRGDIAKIARATITDERFKVSLRIPKSDLTRLKSRALQEGIPYQTLINSIIHKYVTS
jgi:predicted DNA binding CopG/RHH family protein